MGAAAEVAAAGSDTPDAVDAAGTTADPTTGVTGPGEAADGADAVAVEPRRPGRPRDARADAAIIDATLQLLAQGGIAGVSIEAVAATAGVGKATIYRRWPSKEALVLHALLLGAEPPPVADTGSLRGDVEAYLLDVIRRLGDLRHTDVLPHLIGAASYDPEVRSALGEYIRARQGTLRLLLARGAERGELPPSADHDMITAAILGALNYRRLMTGEPLDDDFVARLIDTLF